MLGCNFPSERRLAAGDFVDLRTADFDELSFEGDTATGKDSCITIKQTLIPFEVERVMLTTSLTH